MEGTTDKSNLNSINTYDNVESFKGGLLFVQTAFFLLSEPCKLFVYCVYGFMDFKLNVILLLSINI